MIEILNRQRRLRIDTADLRVSSLEAQELVPEAAGKSVTIVLVSDPKMKSLNSEFRGIDRATDVLSFPVGGEEFEDEGHFGDIVISAETARRQAAENGLELETELRQLILHGMLHLAGYDHETDDGTMNRLELKLRKKLGID